MNLDLLSDLCTTRGVSGSEGPVRDLIREHIQDHVDSIEMDNVGNLVAHREGDAPSIALAAHMDEVGMMIKSIEEDGTARVAPVGHIDPISLVGQRVQVHDLVGIMTTEELANGLDVEEAPYMEDLYVDFGMDPDSVREKVNLGDYVYLGHGELDRVGTGDHICAKALDDRIGCLALVEVARRLKRDLDVTFLFTVQEEVGLQGSQVSSQQLATDYVLVVDMVDCEDLEGTRLPGEGPYLSIMDGGLIGNQCLNNWFRDIAEQTEIDLQFEVSDLGVTDAMHFAIAQGGTPTTTIGVPVKNMHTKDSIASTSDIEELITLLLTALEDPITHCKV